MGSEVFNLAILLTLKDAASGGLDRIEAKMRSAGKEGKKLAAEYNSLRESLNRDLAIGGIGVAGLGALYKGVKAAGDFQSSMTELRTTLAQNTKGGGIDMSALGADMQKAEGIALKLGNALPGTTEDFIEMLQTLKQGGLDVKTIFDGAAESVANLAVANNAVPKDMAKDFAKFGQIYKLKPEEYKPAADIFSRIYTSKGIESSEVIESSKYFQGRAGNALGMTGLKGADESVRLMSYLQKQGLDSSQAGTSASTFFVQLAKNDKALDALRKNYGITFDLFDKKGEFKGVENAVSELEKLKKLNPEQMLVALNALGGEEGAMAGTALVQGGIEGYRQFNAEIDKSISLTDKTKMKSADFNNQMEALSGTLENIKVTVFQPMLPDLTAAAQRINGVAGSVQEFVKENPELAKTVITMTAIATSAMVLYSGLKTVTTGVKMFRMASAFSKSDDLASLFSKTTKEVETTTEALGAASVKTKKLKGEFLSLKNVGKVLLAIEVADFAWDKIQELRKTINEWQKMNTGLDTTGAGLNKAYQYQDSGLKKGEIPNYKERADSALSLLQQGNHEFEKALGTKKDNWSEWLGRSFGALVGKDTNFSLYQNRPTTTDILKNPIYENRVKEIEQMPLRRQTMGGMFPDPYTRTSAEIAGTANLQKRAPMLSDPNTMASFRRDTMPSLGLNNFQKEFTEKLLSSAFPESFNQSSQLLAQNQVTLSQSAGNLSESFLALQQTFGTNLDFYTQQGQIVQTFGQNLTNLQSPVSQMQQNFQNLGNTVNQVPPPLSRVASSANSASGSLDNLSAKIENWQMPTPNVQTVTVSVPQSSAQSSAPFSIFPSHAVGGVVERDGVAMVHAGNVITPAKTRGFGAVNSLVRSAIENKNFGSSAQNFNNSANSSSINSFASNFNTRQTNSSPLANFRADVSDETSRTDSLPQGTVGGNSELGRQAADVQRVISQAANNQLSVNYSPQVTINGASPTAKQDFQQMLNAHSKEIERIAARAMQKGRVRA